MEDCIVVGGGPAGLTAALYLARFLRRVTVFDAQSGRARMIPRTHNLGPFPDGISGIELLHRMQIHAEHFGAVVEAETVSRVVRQDGAFQIETDRQVAIARHVIIASGVFNHRPPLSPEDHDHGLAKGLIRYCPVCDAFEVQDKSVVVIGSGKHGSKEASFIRHFCRSVTLIQPDQFSPGIEGHILAPVSPLKRLAVSDSQIIVTLADEQTHYFDTLYVALGTTPHSDLAWKMGAQVDEAGHILTDSKQRTTVPGVFAVGDVTVGLDQIGVAMGQAAIAATAIHNSIVATA